MVYKVSQYYETFIKKLKHTYTKINVATGHSLTIIKTTFIRFGENHAPLASAGIAYYAMFSLFPALMVVVVFGSYFLESQVVQEQIMTWTREVVPLAETLISQNITRLFELRNTFGIVAFIGLIWSATGVFNSLALNINRAFSDASRRNFLENRIVALGVFIIITGLLILNLLSTTLFHFLPELNIPFLNEYPGFDTFIWQVISLLVPLMFSYLLFWALYFWLPKTSVHPKAAAIGSLFTAICWRLFSILSTGFLKSGFKQYELIYGSLGSVVILMMWVYLTAYLTLLGAHLTAAINGHMKFEQSQKQ